jgi:hypothetical protein
MKFSTRLPHRRGLNGGLRAGVLCIAAGASAAAATPDSGPAASTVPTTAPAGPQLAVYRWAVRPDNVNAFGKWIGDPNVWGEDFTDNSSWDNVENPGWLLKPWGKWVRERPGRTLIFGVPLLPGPWDGSGPTGGTIDLKIPVSLEKGAGGNYNRHFEALARNLVADGLGGAVVRLGWEFNGGWYTWRAAGKAQAMAEYWRQIVHSMRATPGAEHLTFCFNPALGYLGLPAEKAWPGDEFVDYVGVDVYDDSWAKDTYPWPAGTSDADIEARHKKAWETVIEKGDHGLRFWSRFAAEHHKPLALPEWGVSNRPDKHGGLDDPFFIDQMHSFIIHPANNVAFHCYFDVEAPDGHHQLSPGPDHHHKTEFPKSAERFKALFGAAPASGD